MESFRIGKWTLAFIGRTFIYTFMNKTNIIMANRFSDTSIMSYVRTLILHSTLCFNNFMKPYSQSRVQPTCDATIMTVLRNLQLFFQREKDYFFMFSFFWTENFCLISAGFSRDYHDHTKQKSSRKTMVKNHRKNSHDCARVYWNARGGNSHGKKLIPARNLTW